MAKPVNYRISYLGAAIREYRRRRGVSQGELAALLGGSRNTISNWERGIHEPPADAIAAVARALKVSEMDIQTLAMSLLHSAAAERDRVKGTHRVSETSPTFGSAARVPVRMPPRAYQLVYEYCSALEAAGVDEDHIEEARRLMSGETFNTLRKHMADERDEDGWMKDVKAAWVFIRDTLKAQGYDL